MSKDVLLAVIGIIGPLIGFAAAIISRQKKISHRVITEELTEEEKKQSLTVVAPDVKITIYADAVDGGQPIADGKCYVTLLFPGCSSFLSQDGLSVSSVTAFMYGQEIGAGSGAEGFRLGISIRPGTYSLVFKWSSTYSGFWGAKTLQCLSRMDLELLKTGKVTVHLGHRGWKDDCKRPVGEFYIDEATPDDAVDLPNKGSGCLVPALLLLGLPSSVALSSVFGH